MGIQEYLWLSKNNGINIIKLSYKNLPLADTTTPGIVQLQNQNILDDNAVITGHVFLTYMANQLIEWKSWFAQYDTSNVKWINFFDADNIHWSPDTNHSTLTSDDIIGEMIQDDRIEERTSLKLTITHASDADTLGGNSPSYYRNYNNLTNKPSIPTAGTTASAVGTTASGGSATTWSKSDHVHSISLATGDANGQVKIAGTNVSVKGLGSAAYTNSTAYRASTWMPTASDVGALASSAAVVYYTSQTLTDAQKTQARTNIGAGTSSFSGNYNDLTNKPTIPAAQVQANWTQTTTTAVDYIKNKPTLATVATSGSYNDLSNKPTIPTVPGYGTTTAKIGTAAAGTATTVSRSDHVHAIDLATGDNNGQVKIAGTNVSVKGLGSAAYTNSTAYRASTWLPTLTDIGAAAATHTHQPTDIIPLMEKTYDNIKIAANDNANGRKSFMQIVPKDASSIWYVKYTIEVAQATTGGNANYTGYYLCEWSGKNQAIMSYRMYNNFNSDYYMFYTHDIAIAKSANVVSSGHYAGIRLNDASNPTSVARKIIVRVYETKNCTVTLLDSLILNPYYDSTKSANYQTNSTANATSNGLQETGDNDSTAAYIYKSYARIKAGTNGIKSNALALATADGTYESLSVTTGYSANKVRNTKGFDLSKPITWNSSSDIASGADFNSAYLQYHAVDFRYSVNLNWSTQYLTPYKDIYIVGTIVNGLFYVDGDGTSTNGPKYTQTLPTTEDGKYYIFLGRAYNSSNDYRLSLYLEHPIYYYKNGAIQTYIPGTISTNQVTDALPLVAGDNISITPSVSGISVSVNATTSVTSGSTQPVTSGAVYTAINTAIDNAITVALNANY